MSFQNIIKNTVVSKTVLAFLVVVVFLYGTFLITRGKTPHVSELSFVSQSSSANISGSVVPASCNSNPPVSHWGCVPGNPAGQADIGTPPSCNVCPVGLTYNCAQNACLCDNGALYSSRPLCNKFNNVKVSFGANNPYNNLTFTTDTIYVDYGSQATLTWSNTNSAATCVRSGTSNTGIWVSSPSVGYQGTFSTEVYTASTMITKRYTMTCTYNGESSEKNQYITFEGSTADLR